MARVTMTHINGEVDNLDWYENDSLMASLNTEETFDCFVEALEHLQHEAKRFKEVSTFSKTTILPCFKQTPTVR